MNIGDRVSLPATLSHPAGEYRIVQIDGADVRLRSKSGIERWVRGGHLPALIERATPPPSSPVNADSFQRDEGVLRRSGYRVGAMGLPVVNRQIVLRRIFQMPASKLPVGDDELYRAEWGEAASEKRTTKMFRCLENFILLHLGRDITYARSIAEWKVDLHWIDVELRAPNAFRCHPMWFPPDS